MGVTGCVRNIIGRRRDAKIADAGPRVRERVKPPPPAEPYRAVAFRWE